MTDKKIRILGVEDSPTQSAQLEYILQKQSYEVIMVSNGREALEELQKASFDLVISDIVMPEMDGFTLCKRIKREWQNLPVLLLTVLSGPRDILSALKCGADLLFTKPYSQDHLLSQIQYSLINRELREHNVPEMGLEVYFGGEKHIITSSRTQILDLLFSSFELALYEKEMLGEIKKITRRYKKKEVHPEEVEIMIVEDSPTQARMVQHILEARGYHTRLAIHGKDALEKLTENLPDVIISDIVMPEMNGYDMCKTIKGQEELNHIPIILLTELSSPQEVILGLNAGADYYLTKPLREESLLPRIESLLTSHSKKTPENTSEIEVNFGGRTYVINSSPEQMLNLLLSTYENTVHQNQELQEMKENLQKLNSTLADKVDQLTNLNLELVEVKKNLEEQNQRLAMLNQQKNQLIGMAAHDLRNPISVILGYSRFMEKSDEDLRDSHSQFIQRIRMSSEFMLDIINDFLDFSVVESGQLNLRFEDVDPLDLLENNLELNRMLAAKKKIQILLASEGDFPKIKIDPRKIDQVLNNLVTNAIKFSHPETTITVKLLKENDQILFSVCDQGQGIPEDELQTLFNPFQRTSVQSTGGERSTGLGLAIVKKIVEGHGGKLWVKSQVGQGSCFYFSLPVSLSK